MNTHLPQSITTVQHGVSFAISSDADMDISCAIAEVDASEVAPAMTGRDNGAKTSPAIMKTASSRRMVIWRFTPNSISQNSSD